MKQPRGKEGLIGTGLGNDEAVHIMRRMCGQGGADLTRRNLQLFYMAQDAGIHGSVSEIARFADLVRADMLQEGFDRLQAIRDAEKVHPLLEHAGGEEVVRSGRGGGFRREHL